MKDGLKVIIGLFYLKMVLIKLLIDGLKDLKPILMSIYLTLYNVDDVGRGGIGDDVVGIVLRLSHARGVDCRLPVGSFSHHSILFVALFGRNDLTHV